MCGQHEIDSVIVFFYSYPSFFGRIECLPGTFFFFFSFSLFTFNLSLSLPRSFSSSHFLSLLRTPRHLLLSSSFPSLSLTPLDCIHHPLPSTLLFLAAHNNTDSSFQQRHSSLLPIYPPWATRFQKSPAQRQIATRPSWTPNQQHPQPPPLIQIPTALIPMANNTSNNTARAVTTVTF